MLCTLRLRRSVAVLLCLLVMQANVWAQAFGSVNGSVLDQQGAVVANATVTLKNMGTGLERTTISTRDGAYQFSQVPPGTYELRAEAAGFKTAIHTDVVVQVNTPLTLDFEVTAGVATETVTITSGEEVINRQDASIGNTFNQEQIRQLPIEGRNVVDLLSLQPGVLKTDVTDYDDHRSGAVNGARSDQSNVTLDGVDVNDQQGGLAFTSVVPVTIDSVQEFRVTTSNPNAAQGRSSGAQVALVTKQGTNEFHGSLYEFHRNTVTTANTFFNNAAGVDKPKLIRNVFGGSVGGPFVKNKFFFFVNYEGRRDSSEDSIVRTVPSLALRQGIIQYYNNDGGITRLDDSALEGIDPLGIGVNPFVLDVFNQYPLPNDNTVGDGLNTQGFRFKAPIHVQNNVFIARADYQINDNHSLFWRGNLADNYRDELPQFPGGPPRFVELDNSKGFAAGYTALLSSNLTNVFRFGLTRQDLERAGASTSAALGFRGLSDLFAFTYSAARTIPTHNITNDVSWVKGSHTFDFGINWRFIRFHTLNFDNSYPFVRSNTSWLNGTGQELVPGDLDSAFEVAYLDATTALLGLMSYAQVTYYYDRDGSPLPIGSPAKRDFAADEYDFYVQDTWRLRPNLTITAGLRYGIHSPPYEQNGLQVKPTISLADWHAQRSANAFNGIPANAMPNITFDLAGPKNGRDGFYNWDKNNFAPRLSVAWSPGYDKGFLGALFGGPGKSSVRGGFGIVYDRIGAGLANTFDRDGAVGLATQIANPSGELDASTSPRFQGFDVIPGLPAAPPGGFPSTLPPDTFAITFGLDDSLVTPHNYMVDFSVSRELGGGVVLEAAYVGRFARNRLSQIDLAQPVNYRDPVSGMDWYTAAGLLADNMAAGVGPNDIAPIAYFENLWPDLASDKGTATEKVYRISRFLAPDWTFVQYYLDFVFPSRFGPGLFYDDQYSALSAWRSIEDTSYNAAQIMLRKRFAHGITFDFNYTYSKSIDLTSEGERTFAYGNFGSGFIINAFHPEQNRSVSDFDVTHSVNANWLWDLPFGRGRAFGSDMNPFVDAIVGGWQLTGVVRATSGLPISVGNGRIWPTNWNITGYATNVAPIAGNTTRLPDGPNLFPDPEAAIEAFTYTRAGQTGTRNALRGDGFFTLDFGLGKDFAMPFEGHTLQFRWEVFNATNTARFDVQTLSLDLTGGSFGKYSGTLGEPRVMQFGLRYEF